MIEKPLHRGKIEVPLSTFAYLFSELVQYSQMNVSNVGDLERRLEAVGWSVGVRLLEILTYRERAGRRETRLLDMLRFVHSTVWKYMFGRAASDLEQSNTDEDEYMISDNNALFMTKYTSVPKEMGSLNCNAFMAGVVKGVLDGAGFPARVTAHFVTVEGKAQPRTTMLLKFDASVLEREKRLQASA